MVAKNATKNQTLSPVAPPSVPALSSPPSLPAHPHPPHFQQTCPSINKKRKEGRKGNLQSSPPHPPPLPLNGLPLSESTSQTSTTKALKHTTNKNNNKEATQTQLIIGAPATTTKLTLPTLSDTDISAIAADIPNLQKHNEMQSALERKMESSQFRLLNEKLYTITGAEAKELFDQNPELPRLYHSGYRRQVAQWPVNPLTKIIEKIKKMEPTAKVADFGCGEAMLAASVPNHVCSFDLYQVNPRITVCDMSQVPLAEGTMDVAVFCLSLMGTNFKDYIKEANRVLKQGGRLLIAEVKSRIESISEFIEFMTEAGFVYDFCDKRNKMFLWIEFHKSGRGFYSSKERAVALLKPCLYKKR